MGFREIEKDIKNDTFNKPVPVLLYGEESFLVDYYERRLTALFTSGLENDLDFNIFYGDEPDISDEDIMSALDTFPMIMPARVVVVRNHAALFSSKTGKDEEAAGKSKKNTLADFVSDIPQTSRLIFSSNKVNKTRLLYKAIAKHGAVYEFKRLDEADLAGFLRKRFKMYGATVSSDVLNAFIYASGYLEKGSEADLFFVENDANKLASFVLGEGRTAVTNDDIEKCMADVLRTDVFAMLDAISAGKKAAAITLLENALAGGENPFGLISLFAGHFEIMLGHKELSAKGMSDAEITAYLGERSEWRVKKLGGFAKRFQAEKLRQILLKLYDTERMIKSGDIKDKLALTVLIAGL